MKSVMSNWMIAVSLCKCDIYAYMSDKIDELSKSRQEISQILTMDTKLQEIVKSKFKQIQMFKNKIDQLEQLL